MAFEDYSPKDRHISGRVHIASWLILAALVGMLAMVAPMANSTGANNQMAATDQGDCAA